MVLDVGESTRKTKMGKYQSCGGFRMREPSQVWMRAGAAHPRGCDFVATWTQAARRRCARTQAEGRRYNVCVAWISGSFSVNGDGKRVPTSAI